MLLATSLSPMMAAILMGPVVAAGESGDDLFNNFFTDLTPLIALFGERVTLQYTSQSVNVADSILLAIAPLGIITIVVASIRVAGPAWLKAIVGRSRENLAAAEVEVMSSTSNEVCELYNGVNMVRTLGSGILKEFILLRPLPPNSGETEDPTSTQYPGAQAYPDIKVVHGWGGEDYEALPQVNVVRGRGWFRDLLSLFLGHAHKIEPDRVDKDLPPNPLWIITRNQGRREKDSTETAANVTLNCHKVGASRDRELVMFAVIGFILEGGFLVFAASIIYYPVLKNHGQFKEDGHAASTYAFPLLAVGTLMVTLGMFICAQVVQTSTKEKRYEIAHGWGAQMLWLQPKQVVNDQDFSSYIIKGSKNKTEYITSSRSLRENRLYLDPPHPILRRLLDLIVWTYGVENRDMLQLAAIFGTKISVVGYIVQFVGLRAMHWSVSLFQLANSLLMTAIRTWVRRSIASPPEKGSLDNWGDHELEWLATSLAASQVGDKDVCGVEYKILTWEPLSYIFDKNGEGYSPYKYVARESDARLDEVDDYPMRDEMLSEGFYFRSRFVFDHGNGERAGQTSFIPGCECLAQRILDLRISLGKLSGWQQPASSEAARLSSAMEEMLNSAYPKGNGSSGVIWYLPVRVRRHQWSTSTALLLDSTVVKLRFPYEDGRWQVDAGCIQAILALWLFSPFQQSETAKYRLSLLPNPHLRDAASRGESWLQCQDSRTQKCLRILGPHCQWLMRDLKNWMPDLVGSLVKAYVIAEQSTVHTRIPESHVAGFSNDATGGSELGFGIQESPDRSSSRGAAFVAVERLDTLTELYTQDIFTSFAFALAQAMDRIDQDPPSRVETDRSNAEWETKHQTMDLKVRSKGLSSLVQAVVKTGFGDTATVHLCLVPAFSFADKLPLTLVQGLEMRASWHFRHHPMQAEHEYIDLWNSSQDERPGSRTWAVLVASQFELGAACLKLYHSLRNSFSTRDLEQNFTQRRRSRLKLVSNLHEQIAQTWKRLRRSNGVHAMIEVLGAAYTRGFHYEGLEYLSWIREHSPTPEGMSTRHENSLNDMKIFSSPDRSFYRDILGQTCLHHCLSDVLSTGNYRYFRTASHRFEEAINIRDNRGRTVLHVLAASEAKRKKGSFWTLMQMRADLNLQDMYGSTPLHIHASSAAPDEDFTRILMRNHADVNTTDFFRNTPLHCCMGTNDSLGTMRELLDGGADVNSQNTWGETPLHIAAKKGLEFVETLEEHESVTIDARNMWGRTPLCNAVLYEQYTIMETLVRKGANIKIVDRSHKWGLWHIVAAGGSSTMGQYLSGRETYAALDKEAKDLNGRTPLHVAAEWGNGGVVEVLLKNGANMTAVDDKNRRPLEIVVDKANEGAVLAFSQDDLYDLSPGDEVETAQSVRQIAAKRLEEYFDAGLKGNTEAWNRALTFLHKLPTQAPEDHQLKLKDWQEILKEST